MKDISDDLNKLRFPKHLGMDSGIVAKYHIAIVNSDSFEGFELLTVCAEKN